MIAETAVRQGYHVTIDPDARFQIENEIQNRGLKLSDGYETGGLLFGHIDGRRITVTSATGPGDLYQPELGTVNVHPAYILGVEEARAMDGLILGNWHSHPDPGVLGGCDPSDADIQAWEGCAMQSRYDAAVGLIAVTARTGGWITPRIYGWVTSVDRRDSPRRTCERLGELYAT